ncbi:MAG: ATP-binding protein, partial [Deltaproteobacteria bacterium]|nr:ATP-binding protein [Deltaproteobacteria bacterium]
KLTWFKEWMDHLVVIQIIPSQMIQDSPKEDTQPSYYFENFVSWYRHVSQDQGLAFKLMSELKEILPGFEYFKFEATGEKHRLLKAYFNGEEKNVSVGYSFGELSDGQRMLIVLYSLLHFSCSDTKFPDTLCLDEPENFLALPEIQPWLVSLYDHCMDGDVQALLISHHPELINYLLASPAGHWFEHHSNRPTRVKRIAADKTDGLPISELVARGWFNA